MMTPAKQPYDDAVLLLCEEWGFGAVMQSASIQWQEKDPVGALRVGGCFGGVWGKTYNKWLAKGCDHGDAAYRADEAEARSARKWHAARARLSANLAASK